MKIGARKAVLISALFGLLVGGFVVTLPTPAIAQDGQIFFAHFRYKHDKLLSHER